jgi:membrane associated rhomboid family serine protease
MSLLDKFERRLGRFAPTHLTLYLIIGQVFVTLSAMLGLLDLRQFVLVPALVTHGEPWRLVTFLFYPPPVNLNSTFSLVLLPFAWWIFYLMGNALEHYWGSVRYTLFLLLGCVLTIGAAFLTPGAPVTNAFIGGSVFLAFAWLNPDFELSLFFILPVKIKWLALLTCLYYAYGLATGTL